MLRRTGYKSWPAWDIVCKIQVNGGSDHLRIFFIYVRDFHERKQAKKIFFQKFYY